MEPKNKANTRQIEVMVPEGFPRKSATKTYRTENKERRINNAQVGKFRKRNKKKELRTKKEK